MTENDREGGGEATNVPSQTGDESQWHSRSFQLYQHHILYMVVLNEFSIPSFHENGDVQYCFIILSNSDHAGLKGERIKLKFWWDLFCELRLLNWRTNSDVLNWPLNHLLPTVNYSLHSELISEQMQTAVDTCMCHCHRIIPLIISASKTKEEHWHFSVTMLCNWKKSHYSI